MGQQARTKPRPSLSELASQLKGATREQIARALDFLTEDACAALLFDWAFWARPKQLEPAGEWDTLLWLAGRGFGKTRSLCELGRSWVESGRYRRTAVVAATTADIRDTLIEGESGILAICPPWNMPHYEPSKRRLTWTKKSQLSHGAKWLLFSAEEPERLRGPNNDSALADEICAWPDGGRAAWDMLQFTLRKGKDPRVGIATTPKPTELLLEILADPTTHTVKGSTLENVANLAPKFVKKIFAVYGGTRLGRQELEAEVLLDTPGAIFQKAWFDATRVATMPEAGLRRIVVAVDPAPTSNEGSDFTGIFVAGIGYDDHAYLLKDATVKGSPDEWGRAGIDAWRDWKAETLVGEVNTGGEMVEHVFKTIDARIPFKQVRARRGKEKRAEPVAALWEQGKIHIVGEGEAWSSFEKQAGRFTGVNGKRDDRVDAMIWAVHELMLTEGDVVFL